jgi:hypothetical protein
MHERRHASSMSLSRACTRDATQETSWSYEHPSIEAEGGVVNYDADIEMPDEMADVDMEDNDMEDETAVVETDNVDCSSLVLCSTHFLDFQDALPGGPPPVLPSVASKSSASKSAHPQQHKRRRVELVQVTVTK